MSARSCVTKSAASIAALLLCSALAAAGPRAGSGDRAGRADRARPVSARGGDEAAEESRDVEFLRDRLSSIESDLREIQSHRNYRELFESSDGAIIRVQATFSIAQKAIHDALGELADEGTLDPALVDVFHNFMREYLINIEEMPPNHAFGATKAPDARTKKKLIKDVESVISAANEIPGFEEVSRSKLGPRSSAAEAVAFAKRSLTEVHVLLGHRTLTTVTGPGTAAARDLRAALDATWAAIDQLVDGDGDRVLLLDDEGEPRPDQLADFRAAMKEAALQAEFYRRNYLPNAWRDAHRRRALMIEERLGREGFQKQVLAVRALASTSTDAVAGLR